MDEELVPTITDEDLQSWRGMADFYMREGSRRERRLAKALSKAIAWIEGALKRGTRAVHIVQWQPHTEGVYRLVCLICDQTFSECYSPGSVVPFYWKDPSKPCRVTP